VYVRVVIIGICLVWPLRSINFLRHSLILESLTKLRELTSLIFESFVTPPRYSSQGFLLTSPQNSGHENLAACTLQEVAIGVGLEEEERGEDASPLSESHYIPSHSMESSQEDDKPGSAAENLSTALPLIKGNVFFFSFFFFFERLPHHGCAVRCTTNLLTYIPRHWEHPFIACSLHGVGFQ